MTCSLVICTELILAFLLRQWLPVRASVLRYAYIVCVCVRANRFTVYDMVSCVHAAWNSQQFYVLPTQLYLCVLCGSENKRRLFPYTTLTDWFL